VVSAPSNRTAGVLEAPPPRFMTEEVARIASEVFGVDGTAVDLGSERDQTFLIDDGHGGGGVLKVSNLGEDAAVLDFETSAILHVTHVDPELPVARPRSAGAAYLATVEGPDGPHLVRMFERLHGRAHRGAELADGEVWAFAAAHARLNLALGSFFHPAAGRELLWDLQRASKLREIVDSVDDAARRRLVERVIDRYDTRVRPRWPHLRAQVVHGDFTSDNVLLEEPSGSEPQGHGLRAISGIVDFGDIVHTAHVADFAVGLTSLLRGRTDDDVFRTARIAVDGYGSRIPLASAELDVLAHLVAARLATLVTISAWRVRRYPENAEYIQAWDDDSWALLELLDAIGADEVAYRFGASRPPVPTRELAERRRRALGSALTELTYREPVHVVRGEGVWLFDAAGRRLLDAYNNVPVVGHCHPRVTEAVVRQTRTLNTHARYLYDPLVGLAERLAATMPPGSGLDTVMLVNSGSEANELALRFATAATGRHGAIVTDHAYHGVTAAIADLSPEEWPHGYRPPTVETIAPPASDGGTEAAVERAVQRLDDRGVGLAATFVDCGFTSDGIHTPPPDQLEALVVATRAAGGLFVADEVQAGHGRTGEHLWSFAGYGVTPDVVTLGKPMGNGYPVAAVITRHDIVDRFAASAHLFSTFGGNPVAAQAALAVLDVIEDERLIDNAARVGERLRSALTELQTHQPVIAEVRGRGLLIGVELVTRDGAPAASLAEHVVDAMRGNGILIGRTGRRGNVLKIRPPLVFGNQHADMVGAALVSALAGARG
jgi:4-aminobutyrate aminotransferase-like enzyme/Ser/Thr protein kinase RdoA (MazF antagonist)